MGRRRRTVIMLSEVDWTYLWQRHQIFSTFYARNGCRTYYVNRLGMRYPRVSELGYVFRRILTSFGRKKVLPVNEQLEILSPLFLPGNGRIASALNRLLFLPMFLKRLKIDGELILHVYQPTRMTVAIIEALSPCVVIYDCVQNFSEHHLAGPETAALEDALIARADLVMADSEFLFDRLCSHRKDALRVPPGVDVDHFRAAYRGDELNFLKKVFYYGHIRDDLDFELINRIAERPEYQVTLVGTLADNVRTKISSKVRVEGKIEYGNLPSRLREADILLLPYAVNKFTRAILPAKFFECFATGKPILASALPEFLKYREFIHIIDGTCAVEAALEALHAVETQERGENRRKIATGNDWEQRFDTFYSKL